MISFFFNLSFLLLIFCPLQGEVDKVIVTWTAIECRTDCIKQLTKQFQNIPGVAEVSIDKNAGQVTLKWKPNVPFTFSPINVAMELIGLTINDIRVRARGKLQHTPQNVTLVSLGDNTRFDLLNPVVPNTHRQVPEFNFAGRALQPELKQKLLDAEDKQQIATIEGPLLFPERSPPLQLIVDHISFAAPPKKQ